MNIHSFWQGSDLSLEAYVRAFLGKPELQQVINRRA